MKLTVKSLREHGAPQSLLETINWLTKKGGDIDFLDINYYISFPHRIMSSDYNWLLIKLLNRRNNVLYCVDALDYMIKENWFKKQPGNIGVSEYLPLARELLVIAKLVADRTPPDNWKDISTRNMERAFALADGLLATDKKLYNWSENAKRSDIFYTMGEAFSGLLQQEHDEDKKNFFCAHNYINKAINNNSYMNIGCSERFFSISKFYSNQYIYGKHLLAEQMVFEFAKDKPIVKSWLGKYHA